MIAFSDIGIKNLDMFGDIDGTRGTIINRGEWVVFKTEHHSSPYDLGPRLSTRDQSEMIRKGFRTPPGNPAKRIPARKSKRK